MFEIEKSFRDSFRKTESYIWQVDEDCETAMGLVTTCLSKKQMAELEKACDEGEPFKYTWDDDDEVDAKFANYHNS